MSSFSSLCVRAGMPPILKKKTETKTWQHLESSCSSNKRSNVPLHFLRVFVKEAPAVFTFVCVCCCKYAEQCIFVAMVMREPDCVFERSVEGCVTSAREKVDIRRQTEEVCVCMCVLHPPRLNKLTCHQWWGLQQPCRLLEWTPWRWSKAPSEPRVSSHHPLPDPARPPLCGPGRARPAEDCSPWSWNSQAPIANYK